MDADVYFFDCDKTLYRYNFRKRLPRLAVLTGASVAGHRVVAVEQPHPVQGLLAGTRSGGSRHPDKERSHLGRSRWEKPERRIYTRALGVFGVEPENAILFDDNKANVVGAKAAGMHAWQLKRNGSDYDVAGLNKAIDDFANRSR